MFITEQELFELKYQKDSQYFGKTLAQIFFDKFRDANIDFFVAIRPFYHRFFENEICFVRFADNSVLSIEKVNGKWSHISISNNEFSVVDASYQLC